MPGIVSPSPHSLVPARNVPPPLGALSRARVLGLYVCTVAREAGLRIPSPLFLLLARTATGGSHYMRIPRADMGYEVSDGHAPIA